MQSVRCASKRNGAAALPVALFIGAIVSVNGSPLPAQRVQRSFQPQRVLAAQPAIVEPPMQSTADANQAMNPSELVLGVTIGKESRAYPINMLTGPSREIINDHLGGQAIAATW